MIKKLIRIRGGQIFQLVIIAPLNFLFKLSLAAFKSKFLRYSDKNKKTPSVEVAISV